jgi:hypothetical protein
MILPEEPVGISNTDIKYSARGGGLKYLHRHPASCRRQREEKPVLGGITGYPVSGESCIQGPGPPRLGLR